MEIQPNSTFAADIALMASSASPVTQALADFMTNVLSLCSEAVLETCRISDLEHVYKEAFTAAVLYAGEGGFGSVRVIFTRKDTYYLIYFPTKAEEEIVKKIYEGFSVASPERFSPDPRSIALEVRLTDPVIAARAIVRIEDNEQPMTGGLITYQRFASVHPELLSQIVERLKKVLMGNSFRVGQTRYVIPPAIENDQTF